MNEGGPILPSPEASFHNDHAELIVAMSHRMNQALAQDAVWDEAYDTLTAITGARVACLETNKRELLSPVPGCCDPEIDSTLLDQVIRTTERDWLRSRTPNIQLVEPFRAMVAACADSRGLRGAIVLAFGERESGSASSPVVLASVASLVGAALGRLAMQATTVPAIRHNAEVERSRKEMSRVLHDGPAQDLAMASMALEQMLSARRSGNNDLDEVAREYLDRAIQGMRRFISDLRDEKNPVSLDQLKLPPRGSIFPDQLQEQAVLAITREAIRNARKHANAETLAITIRNDLPGLEVQIEDDGQGFRPGSAPGHFGLVQMQETATNLGGTVVVQSNPGAGTKVRLVTPLHHAPVPQRAMLDEEGGIER